MANINLLPWREWERERKRKEFLTQLVVVLVIGLLLVFGAGWQLDNSIGNQNQRNERLERGINRLDSKIAEIRTLRKERQDLLARMQVIQQLQGNRPVIVRVFDEMVQTLAKGVHYRKLEMQGVELAVSGIAESNNRISALMRSLDGSEWFTEPNLKSIKEDPTNSDYGEQASTFELVFVQENPNNKSVEENL